MIIVQLGCAIFSFLLLSEQTAVSIQRPIPLLIKYIAFMLCMHIARFPFNIGSGFINVPAFPEWQYNIYLQKQNRNISRVTSCQSIKRMRIIVPLVKGSGELNFRMSYQKIIKLYLSG